MMSSSASKAKGLRLYVQMADTDSYKKIISVVEDELGTVQQLRQYIRRRLSIADDISLWTDDYEYDDNSLVSIIKDDAVIVVKPVANSVASSPVTSPPVDLRPVTSLPITLRPITIRPIMSSPVMPSLRSLSSPPVNFTSMTSSPIISRPITTSVTFSSPDSSTALPPDLSNDVFRSDVSVDSESTEISGHNSLDNTDDSLDQLVDNREGNRQSLVQLVNPSGDRRSILRLPTVRFNPTVVSINLDMNSDDTDDGPQEEVVVNLKRIRRSDRLKRPKKYTDCVTN